jgi:hypothetical protein
MGSPVAPLSTVPLMAPPGFITTFSVVVFAAETATEDVTIDAYMVELPQPLYEFRL